MVNGQMVLMHLGPSEVPVVAGACRPQVCLLPVGTGGHRGWAGGLQLF